MRLLDGNTATAAARFSCVWDTSYLPAVDAAQLLLGTSSTTRSRLISSFDFYHSILSNSSVALAIAAQQFAIVAQPQPSFSESNTLVPVKATSSIPQLEALSRLPSPSTAGESALISVVSGQ